MIIIARLNEDVNWAKEYNHFIVQKDVHLPNIGREPLSYIWYIIKYYDELEGIYIFCQGNPFHHYKDAHTVFEHPEPGFNWYSDMAEIQSDLDGRPYDNGLEIDVFLKNCGIECKQNGFFFNAGCFFSIEAEQIKRKPKKYYERVYKALLMTNKAPWAFERVVYIIFGVGKYENNKRSI
ncbi:hypothetical protein [uncultured Arcobacter sp.]|uniref:hypothetical protein n=1 Tax=uncultured Arcobacter sp. TaxID=165434 RepID=UPI00261F99CE|nr:hypothetical protein [uncultured Arcobacter sp.]